MSSTLTPKQHRFLKQLLDKGGKAASRDLKPATEPAVRLSLIQDHWVTQEKQGQSVTFALTEAGRAWITEHPQYVPPPKPFPKPNQRLFLLQLAFAGGTAPGKELKPALTPAERKSLSAEKLLQSQKGPRGSLIFTLTDAGWKWAEDHLADADNTAGVSGAAAATLQRVLVKVGTYLAGGDMRLADLVRTRPAPGQVQQAEPGEASWPFSEIENAIAAACLGLGQGRDRQRLRLADVRRELTGWERPAIDAALLELAKRGCLVLYGMDDPKEIQAEDREAEFKTPSGEVRHLVYWIGRRTAAAQ